MVLEVLEQKGAKKTVLLDGEFYCRCYPKDILNAGLKDGAEASQEALQRLEERILLPRAKERSLALLGKQSYTKRAMRRKLEADGHPAAVVEKTLAYLDGFHYLDDLSFGSDYAYAKLQRMSERELTQKMQGKGFDSETIRESLMAARRRLAEEAEVSGEEPERAELAAIRAFLRKKGVADADAGELDRERKQKLIMALFRKGFLLPDIRQVLGELEYGDFSE